MQRGIKKLKWSKKRIITLSIASIVIISIVIGGVLFTKNNAAISTMASAQRTIQVTKGNIEVSLSGSGTVASASTSDLMSNVQGKITKSYFNEGDKVKKGDLLFEIDDTDAKLNIQKIENSISLAQLNVNSNEKSYSNLTITAPISGKVTGVTAVKGESVNNGMSLFTITDTAKLKILVPFSTTYISNIKVGQKAQVQVQEIMNTVEGTVTGIDDYSYTASNGGTVRNVEVTVTNPGSLSDKMTASVDIATSNGLESGSQICSLEYANKQVVKASTMGTFSTVNIDENQYVNKGDVLLRIENDDLQVTSQTNELKIQDLNNQLVAAQKQLENYKIYSPIEGTITAIKSVVGDSVKSGDIVISIRDFNQMQFTISVDELDISKVKLGQKAAITIDALTDTTAKPLDGEVIYKAMEGTSTNGVATYDIKIKINETENLLAGMNANAKIILNDSQDTLMLPLEAITKMGNRSFVRVVGTAGKNDQAQTGVGMNGGNRPGRITSGAAVSSDTGTGSNSSNSNSKRNGTNGQGNSTTGISRQSAAFKANQQYYANTIMKPVELGINNDTYVEIKSGLAEGDVVVLPPLVTNSTSSNKTTTQSGGFNLGGMGGGVQPNRNFSDSGSNSNKANPQSQRN